MLEAVTADAGLSAVIVHLPPVSDCAPGALIAALLTDLPLRRQLLHTVWVLEAPKFGVLGVATTLGDPLALPVQTETGIARFALVALGGLPADEALRRIVSGEGGRWAVNREGVLIFWGPASAAARARYGRRIRRRDGQIGMGQLGLGQPCANSLHVGLDHQPGYRLVGARKAATPAARHGPRSRMYDLLLLDSLAEADGRARYHILGEAQTVDEGGARHRLRLFLEPASVTRFWELGLCALDSEAALA